MIRDETTTEVAKTAVEVIESKINLCLIFIFYLYITFELSGPKGRSLFGSGGGSQARNELERLVMRCRYHFPFLHLLAVSFSSFLRY